MAGNALVIPESELGISTKSDSSGKVEITSPDFDLLSHEDRSIKELIVAGVLEFIPGKLRGAFMDECFRVLAEDGKIIITVPYYTSWRAIYDTRLQWPPFCEQSFLCYNKDWRESNMPNLILKCDFDFTYGYVWDAETAARNDESRSFWTKHYANAIDALQLTFTKRPC